MFLHFLLRALRDKYKMEVPNEAGTWPQTEDDIPEMHFPSSDEGAGQFMIKCIEKDLTELLYTIFVWFI